MAVMPDGELRLIPDLALDSRYEHTLWFDSAEEQADYFISKSTKWFTNLSYNRVQDGVIRIQGSIATLDQMCYMMFRNTKQTNHAYGNKWFYAFVTSAKYINENTVELTYELDLIQTWLFEFHLNKCFVEREHSATDVAGDNIVPENIRVSDYLYTKPTHPTANGLTMNDLSVVVAYNEGTFDLYGKLVEANESLAGVFTRWRNLFVSGTYYGLCFLAVPATKEYISALNSVYRDIEFFNSIICSFVMPTMFLNSELKHNDYNTRATMSLSCNTDFDGYVPANQKMFTHPYTCAYLTSFRGEGYEFEFEKFAPKGTATFNVEGALSLQPSVFAYPTNYRKVNSYLEGAVSIPTYPVSTWGEDGLTEWMNNNMFKAMVGVGGAAISGGVVNKSMSAIVRKYDAVDSATESAIKELTDLACAPFNPGKVHGNASSDLLMGTSYGRRIMVFCKHLSYQSARIVDQYFSMYGYAVNRVKVPARNNRPCWNYVKTKGCTGHGFVPSADIKAICAIYDKGITFWKKDAQICSYNFDANKLA